MSKLPSFPDELIGSDLAADYAFSCPGCKHEQRLKPSLFMRIGINQGSGKCSRCGMRVALSIKSASEMDAKPEDIYGPSPLRGFYSAWQSGQPLDDIRHKLRQQLKQLWRDAEARLCEGDKA